MDLINLFSRNLASEPVDLSLVCVEMCNRKLQGAEWIKRTSRRMAEHDIIHSLLGYLFQQIA
jgi:hypothetical protein